ncbi:TNF receptor-associated factor 2-like isoform X1 [Lethenteron reissneri]|uniref:TNF receptor-associated factor 2-like isoform X1 n=2 Tax=Lethenteron reissneri TaxID=7753 RepID=UPI002AB7B6BF|nr:TNF receptor-associated factor 2-like isoform X1 [Lethenteron reissneri]
MRVKDMGSTVRRSPCTQTPTTVSPLPGPSHAATALEKGGAGPGGGGIARIMGEALAVLSAPVRDGYPLEVLRHEPDFKYLCGACGRLLRAAVQAPCGHRFCHGCHSKLATRPEQWLCPRCQEEGTHEEELYSSPNNQCFPDRATRREVDQLPARCTNPGCSWSGIVRDYDGHESSCELRWAACPACGGRVRLRELAEHAQKSCPARTAPCRHCRAPCTAQELPEHDLTCPKFPTTCTACGKRKIPREKLPLHEKSCLRVKRPCRFADIGCPFQAEAEKLAGHEQLATASHVAILRSFLLRLHGLLPTQAACAATAEAAGDGGGGGGSGGGAAAAAAGASVPQLDPASDGRLSELALRLSRLEVAVAARGGGGAARRVGRPSAAAGAEGGAAAPGDGKEAAALAAVVPAALEQRCARLERSLGPLEATVAALDRQAERCSAAAREAHTRRQAERGAVATLTGKMQALERKLALREVALADMTLRLSTLELSSHDGSFVWRVGDVGRRRSDAASGRQLAVYSPAFFTSRYGYKMCLRLYPSGDGAGKDSHLSLFFVLMRGDHDATLRWPFRQKVTLMLLDQSSRRDHVVDAFRPDATTSSFQRPTGDLNVASGCPLFCPLARLVSSEQTYVRDDTLFIKCVVDTTDL